MVFVVACSEEDTSGGTDSSSNDDGNGEESSSGLENVELAITTGNTGSAIYALGGGLKAAIENHIPESKVSVIGSAGYGENAVMLANKEADIGTTSLSVAELALEDMLKDNPDALDGLRTLSTAHATVIHAVVEEKSDIETLEDLKGKRVSIGEPGSGTETTNRALFEAFGMTYDDIDAQRLSFNETIEAFQDGKIDAFIITTMYPNPNILSLQTQKDIRLLTFDQEDAERLNEVYSGQFIETEILPDTYNNDEPILSIGAPAAYIVHEDMDEELAYELAKIMNLHSDEIERVHPAGAQWGLDNALHGFDFPYHKGAVQFFKDEGVWDDRSENVTGDE